MTNHDTKPNSVNCYIHVMHDGDADTTFILFISEAWFKLSGYVNSQGNSFLHYSYEAHLQDVKVGVWCAISAARIIGPSFVSWALNSHRHATFLVPR